MKKIALIAGLLLAALVSGAAGPVVVSVALSNITGLGTGVATLLATNTTGSTNLVGATSPTLVTPTLGVASATSINFGGNALDTYTVGSWTPAITTDGTVGTPAYTVQIGSYERIGRLTVVRATLVLSGWTGSPTGNVSISGLPVASANVAGDQGQCSAGSYTVTGLAASNIGIGGLIAPNTSAISLRQFSNTAGTNITAAQFGTTGVLAIFCTYRSS